MRSCDYPDCMTRKERMRVAVKADVDPRTVARWLEDSDSVHTAIAATIAAACAELGLDVSRETLPDAADTLPSAAEGAS